MEITKREKQKPQNHWRCNTHTHTHTHKYNLLERETIAPNVTNQIKSRRTQMIVPLIVMLILTIIIPTIIYVGKNIIQQPTETAEIEKQENTNEEKISAALVRVEAGDSYTVPKDGVYKIELHGGKSEAVSLSTLDGDDRTYSGNAGKKVTGYVSLSKGDILDTEVHWGGGWKKLPRSYFGAGGGGISLSINGKILGSCSGGPAPSFRSFVGCEICGTGSGELRFPPNETYSDNPGATRARLL